MFKESIQVGSGNDSSQLQDDRLIIRGHTLSYNSAGLQSNAHFSVGSANAYRNLTVYGEIETKSNARIADSIFFGTVGVIKKSANGIDIDITT